MVRFEIKRSSVKIFKTEYVPLKRDSSGKPLKGTGESVEKSIATFKRNETDIPEDVKKIISKTDYSSLEKALLAAHEDDIKLDVNKSFIETVEGLAEYEKLLHLIEFDRELCKKIDKTFGIIKRKARAAMKEIKENSSPGTSE